MTIDKPKMNIISLGAGVQSSVMALMSAKGQITPMPDCAIFADTQWEPEAVYEHLDWLESQLPFPVYRVTAGSIREKVLKPGYSDIPWHTSKGIGRRQCTKVFKLNPIRDKVKELAGVTHGRELAAGMIKMWLGISLDEVWRMKESQVKYMKNIWPLIDKEMNRNDCHQWFDREYPKHPGLVKSACIGCPLKGDAHWRDTQRDKTSWKDAIEVDRAIRDIREEKQFMHHSKKPLEEVDLRTLRELGQGDLFNEDCEGMCGV